MHSAYTVKCIARHYKLNLEKQSSRIDRQTHAVSALWPFRYNAGVCQTNVLLPQIVIWGRRTVPAPPSWKTVEGRTRGFRRGVVTGKILSVLCSTRNAFYGTRYLSHCSARFAFNPLFVNWVTSLTLVCVIGHVTIGTADGHSYWLSIDTMISHRCRDIKRHNLDNHIPIVNTLETNFGDFGSGRGLCYFSVTYP